MATHPRSPRERFSARIASSTRWAVAAWARLHRAHDSTLGREVAIKVLPDDVMDDPARLARFQREARLLASLNHPHVGAIYTVVEDEQRLGLVLELVEGPTLAERLAQGPLPLRRALEIAQQIAAAIDAAHQQSIVHRDLKPANIKLSPGGVKGTGLRDRQGAG